MAKPSFQWYPDDWMNDLNLRGCSPASRAIWMDMLCLMHQGEPYGFLASQAGPLPVSFVARRCGITTRQLGLAINELEKHGVFSRDANGIIYSRRMDRDEKRRVNRAVGGPLSQLNQSVPKKKGILRVSTEKVSFHPEEEEEEVFLLESNKENLSEAWFVAEHSRWYDDAFWNKKHRQGSLVAYTKAIARLMAIRKISGQQAADFLFQAAIDDKARFEHTEDWTWRAKLHPSTWLNGDRWDDQPSLTVAPLKRKSKGEEFEDMISRL